MIDLINSMFVLAGGSITWLNVYKLYKDKQVKGVHVVSVAVFALWGFWSLYFYSSLDQWFSFAGGICIALANTVWVTQIIYYIRIKNEKKI